MDYLDLMYPSSWPGYSIAWFYLAIAVFSYFVISTISNKLYVRAIYAPSRVNSLEEGRKAVWERKQKQFDPDVAPLDSANRQDKPTDQQFKPPSEPKKKFKSIFGMDSFAGRASCSTGS